MGLVIYLIDDAVGNESPKTHGQLALHKSVTTSCSIDNFTTNFIVFRLAIRHEGSHFLKRYYRIFLNEFIDSKSHRGDLTGTFSK